MNCFIHSNSSAKAQCGVCHKPFCSDCLQYRGQIKQPICSACCAIAIQQREKSIRWFDWLMMMLVLGGLGFGYVALICFRTVELVGTSLNLFAAFGCAGTIAVLVRWIIECKRLRLSLDEHRLLLKEYRRS